MNTQKKDLKRQIKSPKKRHHILIKSAILQDQSQNSINNISLNIHTNLANELLHEKILSSNNKKVLTTNSSSTNANSIKKSLQNKSKNGDSTIIQNPHSLNLSNIKKRKSIIQNSKLKLKENFSSIVSNKSSVNTSHHNTHYNASANKKLESIKELPNCNLKTDTNYNPKKAKKIYDLSNQVLIENDEENDTIDKDKECNCGLYGEKFNKTFNNKNKFKSIYNCDYSNGKNINSNNLQIIHSSLGRKKLEKYNKSNIDSANNIRKIKKSINDLKSLQYLTSTNINNKNMNYSNSKNKKSTNLNINTFNNNSIINNSNFYKNYKLQNKLKNMSSKSTNNFFNKNQNNLINFKLHENMPNNRENSVQIKRPLMHNFYLNNLSYLNNTHNSNMNKTTKEMIDTSDLTETNHQNIDNKNATSSSRCKIDKKKFSKIEKLNIGNNHFQGSTYKNTKKATIKKVENKNKNKNFSNTVTNSDNSNNITEQNQNNIYNKTNPNNNFNNNNIGINKSKINTTTNSTNAIHNNNAKNNNNNIQNNLNNNSNTQNNNIILGSINVKKIQEIKDKLQLRVEEESEYFDYDEANDKSNELTKEEKNIYGNRDMKDHKKIKLLGKGGCGVVWLCTNTNTNEQCAVKQISKKNIPAFCLNNLQMAKNEIEILQVLNSSEKSPYIVDFYSSYEDQNDIWFSFEKGGRSLTNLSFKIKGEFVKNERIYTIKKGKVIQGLFENITQFKLLIKYLLKGIDFINKKGIIHSDIKPENILIEYENNRKTGFQIKNVKIIDYGSAFYANNFRNITSNTPEYLCPELTDFLEGKIKLSKLKIITDLEKYISCVDIWSLGVTLIELVLACPVWMSFKAKIFINGKTFFRTGLFGFIGRDGNKIKSRQVELCANLHKFLAQSMTYLFSNEDKNNFEDLLGRMLCFDYKNRITPEEALRHDFLKDVVDCKNVKKDGIKKCE